MTVEDGDGLVEKQDDTKITFRDAFWYVCSCNTGASILAMPFVIKLGGIWSIIATILMNVLSNYTAKIFIECLYDDVIHPKTGKTIKMRTRESYSEVGKAVWSSCGRQIILFCQFLELLFIATESPIVASALLKLYVPQSDMPTAMWPVFFGILLYPSVFLRHVYQVSKLSRITVICIVAVAVLMLMYCLTMASSWKVTGILVFCPEDFLICIGVIVTGCACQMYLPVIENKMKNPKQFGVVMNYGFIATTLLKITLGVFGYLTFGQTSKDVTTLNLPTGVLSTVGNVTAFLLVLSCYSLPMFAIFQILEIDWPLLQHFHNLQKRESRSEKLIEKIIRLGARSTIVLVTLFIAVALPHFALFASFIGFFTASLLSNIFPCLFYVILKYRTLNKKEIIFNSIIVIITVCVMAMGLYTSLTNIITAFQADIKTDTQ